MIAVQQTKRGGPDVPPEERGDCLPACLASLLEVPIEDVPVPHSDDVHWWDVVQAALQRHGYHLVIADKQYWPWGWWIAAVPSLNLVNADGTPCNHVVVMHGAELAHDPALSKRYAIGTSIDDLEIIEGYVLVPREPRSLALVLGDDGSHNQEDAPRTTGMNLLDDDHAVGCDAAFGGSGRGHCTCGAGQKDQP